MSTLRVSMRMPEELPMGQGLSEIEEAMSSYAAAFEVGELPPSELGPALRSAGRIEKLASALCSMLAARMATGAGGDGEGPLRRVAERHAERELAAAAGTSLEDARRAIEVGKAIAQQPDLAAAARDGELSRRQAALISDAVSVDPEAASDLVEKASRMALGELQAECARAKAAKLDLEQRRRVVHAARSVRWYTDPLGTFHLHAEGTVEDGALVVAALRPLADRAFRTARKEGRRERPEAYAWDALLDLATSGGAAAPRGEVLFRCRLRRHGPGLPRRRRGVRGGRPRSCERAGGTRHHRRRRPSAESSCHQGQGRGRGGSLEQACECLPEDGT